MDGRIGIKKNLRSYWKKDRCLKLIEKDRERVRERFKITLNFYFLGINIVENDLFLDPRTQGLIYSPFDVI